MIGHPEEPARPETAGAANLGSELPVPTKPSGSVVGATTAKSIPWRSSPPDKPAAMTIRVFPWGSDVDCDGRHRRCAQHLWTGQPVPP